MQNRRKFLLTLTAAVVGMGFVVASVVADELIGFIIKADADAKKITVLEKDSEKEIEVKVTDETEYVAGKAGTGKVDFEKLEKGIERAKEKGRKGISVKITHEKAVASKIVVEKKSEEVRELKRRADRSRAGKEARSPLAIHLKCQIGQVRMSCTTFPWTSVSR